MSLVKEVILGEIKKLPQYYGFSTLMDLASQNVEQFLDLSAKMYELLVAKKISDPSHYVHSQDHLMTAIEAKTLIEGMIRMYRRIDELEKKQIQKFTEGEMHDKKNKTATY